jgi:CO/xanthine dehydrogenase FAD-binding subunit
MACLPPGSTRPNSHKHGPDFGVQVNLTCYAKFGCQKLLVLVGGFQKFNRRAQDWAIVGVAAWRNNGSSGVALVNMGSTPILATSVSAALTNGATIGDAAELAAAEATPQDDLNVSSEYRIHLAKVLVRRALEDASKR